MGFTVERGKIKRDLFHTWVNLFVLCDKSEVTTYLVSVTQGEIPMEK